MRQRLKSLDQVIVAIDPMGELDKIGLGHLRRRLNPLAEIDQNAPDYVEKLRTLADSQVLASDGEAASYWNEGARTIIAGMCDYVKRSPAIADQERHLPKMRELLTDEDGVGIEDMAALGGLAKAAGSLLAQAGEEARSGLLSTAITHTAWLDSQGMRDTLSASDITLEHLGWGNMTVYLVLSPQYLEMHARFLRLFVTVTLGSVMNSAVVHNSEHPTLFVLDETYALGRLEALVRAAAVARGYGVRLWTVWQGLSQAQELYPRNYQTFLANAGQNQVFATNDLTTMGHFADRLGTNVRFHKVQTETGFEWRPGSPQLLRTGEELGRSTSRGSGRQMVFIEGGDTFLLRRAHYDDLFRKGSYASDPYEARRKPSLWRRWCDLVDDVIGFLGK